MTRLLLAGVMLALVGNVTGKPAPPPSKPNINANTGKPKPASRKPPVTITRQQPNRAVAASRQKPTIFDSNSFKAPFENFESSGDRQVNEHWSVGGDADINHNYLRITKDRQDQRGWLYNDKPLATTDFAIEVKFRVSGQGSNLYGDGFALWVTQNGRHDWSRDGDFYAGPRGFKGFAVVFDTYKNAEMATTHKDIYLLSNNGDTELDIHTPIAGCSASYRWFEKRDDFSPLDFAIARISYSSASNKLTVEIDGQNTDRFTQCFSTNLPHKEFVAGAHIALSSTTGQLADNHDIMAITTTRYGQRLPRDDELAGSEFRDLVMLEQKLSKLPNGQDYIQYIKAHRAEQEKRFNHLHHTFEHELEFLRDSMSYMVKQIRDAEMDDAKRIDKLEEIARKAADDVAARQMDTIKREIKGEVEAHQTDLQRENIRNMKEIEESLDSKLDGIGVAVGDMMEEQGDDTIWKASSVVLLLIILVIVVVGYRKYMAILKYNHLP